MVGNRRLRWELPPVESDPVTMTEVFHDAHRVVAAAPGHVGAVRHFVIDALTTEQVEQLGAIAAALLGRLDPDGRMLASEA